MCIRDRWYSVRRGHVLGFYAPETEKVLSELSSLAGRAMLWLAVGVDQSRYIFSQVAQMQGSSYISVGRSRRQLRTRGPGSPEPRRSGTQTLRGNFSCVHRSRFSSSFPSTATRDNERTPGEMI